MKTRILAAALIAALAQPALAASGAYWNNVDGSFERMLSHQPYAGPTQVNVVLGEIDPVEASLHASLRDSDQPASRPRHRPVPRRRRRRVRAHAGPHPLRR